MTKIFLVLSVACTFATIAWLGSKIVNCGYTRVHVLSCTRMLLWFDAINSACMPCVRYTQSHLKWMTGALPSVAMNYWLFIRRQWCATVQSGPTQRHEP